jgi:hypothetical protein
MIVLRSGIAATDIHEWELDAAIQADSKRVKRVAPNNCLGLKQYSQEPYRGPQEQIPTIQ